MLSFLGLVEIGSRILEDATEGSNDMPPIKIVRRVFQIFFLGSAVWLALKIFLKVPTRTVEYYCPMGGIVSFYGLFKRQQFICALGEMNLGLAFALLGAVLISKRSFCSWICPIGGIAEFLSWIRAKIGLRDLRTTVSSTTDSVVSKVKYVVLLMIIVMSYKLGELVFRGFDPFYIIFTGGKGHGLFPVASVLIAFGVLIGLLVYNYSWCRFVCPLAAVMNPISRIGILKIKRDRARCTGCQICEAACPHGIPVHEKEKVINPECTVCFECILNCPVEKALDLSV